MFTFSEGVSVSIAVVYRPPNMTAEQYKASWSSARTAANCRRRGASCSTGSGEGDDFFTITVWESQEAYDEFAPVFKEVMASMGFDFGVPTVLPVHHHRSVASTVMSVEGHDDRVGKLQLVRDADRAPTAGYLWSKRLFDRQSSR